VKFDQSLELAEIAAMISDTLERYMVAEALAAWCQRDNPRFDRTKFMETVAFYAR
jgi:hypothetical protein